MAVTDTLFVGRVLIVPVGIATPTITPSRTIHPDRHAAALAASY
jgi:hypothetical protein